MELRSTSPTSISRSIGPRHKRVETKLRHSTLPLVERTWPRRTSCASTCERAPLDSVDLSVLTHEREEALLRALSIYPEVLHDAAEQRGPQKVTTWVRDFAREFHGFYRDCRVLTGDPALTQARLWLTEASRIGLANALGLLGVNAPDEMARLDNDDEVEDANA